MQALAKGTTETCDHTLVRCKPLVGLCQVIATSSGSNRSSIAALSEAVMSTSGSRI